MDKHTPLVLVSGHFWTVHADHERLFAYARTYGLLVVGLNGEQEHARKYGKRAKPLDRRIALLIDVGVEHIITFNEPTPEELILKLKPTFYVKGPDYAEVLLPEQPALDTVGTTLVIRPGRRIISSSDLF